MGPSVVYSWPDLGSLEPSSGQIVAAPQGTQLLLAGRAHNVGLSAYVADMDASELTDHELGREMELRLECYRNLADADAGLYEVWSATGVLADMADDEQDDPDVEVVRVRLVRCSLGGPDLWRVLDGLEADLGTVASVLLDTESGEVKDELNVVPGLGSHLLILDKVECDSRFQGRQIGRWIASEAIGALTPGTEIVGAIAAPLNCSDDAVQKRASAKLRKVWASVGFVDVERRRHVMALNPDLRTTHDRRAVLRERFGLGTMR